MGGWRAVQSEIRAAAVGAVAVHQPKPVSDERRLSTSDPPSKARLLERARILHTRPVAVVRLGSMGYEGKISCAGLRTAAKAVDGKQQIAIPRA